MLAAEAPELIVPELRPYRSRGEIGSWMKDQSVVRYLEERLAKYRYVGIGEQVDDLMVFDPESYVNGLFN